jgi:hypothetical protein
VCVRKGMTTTEICVVCVCVNVYARVRLKRHRTHTQAHTCVADPTAMPMASSIRFLYATVTVDWCMGMGRGGMSEDA